MFGKRVFLISGIESEEALLLKIKEILPIGWRQPYGGSNKTLEEIVFGHEAKTTLFNQSLVPRNRAGKALAISFDVIDGLGLGERIPGAIRSIITHAVEQLGGKVDIKTVR